MIYVVFPQFQTVNSTEKKLNETHGTAKRQINLVSMKCREQFLYHTFSQIHGNECMTVSPSLEFHFHWTALKQSLCREKYRYVLSVTGDTVFVFVNC